MRHRKRNIKLGRKAAHARAMLANQVCSLIDEERIETTVPKAKETRRLAEKMVSLGKKGSLHDRRRAISKLRNVDSVGKLFSEIAPRYLNREGGYTRIIRLGSRRGDAAETCILEWVSAELEEKKTQRAKAVKAEKQESEDAEEEANAKAAAEAAEESEAKEEAPEAKAEEAEAKEESKEEAKEEAKAEKAEAKEKKAEAKTEEKAEDKADESDAKAEDKAEEDAKDDSEDKKSK